MAHTSDAMVDVVCFLFLISHGCGNLPSGFDTPTPTNAAYQHMFLHTGISIHPRLNTHQQDSRPAAHASACSPHNASPHQTWAVASWVVPKRVVATRHIKYLWNVIKRKTLITRWLRMNFVVVVCYHTSWYQMKVYTRVEAFHRGVYKQAKTSNTWKEIAMKMPYISRTSERMWGKFVEVFRHV